MELIDKQKLLEWIARMSIMYEAHGYENHLFALNAVSKEIESGTFDDNSAQEEIAKLEQERTYWATEAQNAISRNVQLEQERDEWCENAKSISEDRNALLEGLKWYADETKHQWDIDAFDEVTHSEVMDDRGERARSIIAKIEASHETP